jgi:DNA (cytosine-5)-methyltransferase 1
VARSFEVVEIMPLNKLRHVDLCSGIGGFSLGFEWAELSEPVVFCDIDKWCRKILAQHWPDVPIYNDVKEIADDSEKFIPGGCDILTAGYPCQPFSLAGQRKGEEDDRHIWPYIMRIIKQQRPAWCVLENVYGHVSMGLDNVLLDLEAEGYTTRPFIVPACGVKALHKRDRVWIVAYTESIISYERQRGDNTKKDEEEGLRIKAGTSGKFMAYTESNETDGKLRTTQPKHDSRNTWVESERCNNGQPSRKSTSDVAHANELESQGRIKESLHGEPDLSREFRRSCADFSTLWSVEPNVGRVANGIPRRVDRLKGLGNAIVPQIAMQIGLAI